MTSQTIIICNHCGKDNSEGSLNCAHCNKSYMESSTTNIDEGSHPSTFVESKYKISDVVNKLKESGHFSNLIAVVCYNCGKNNLEGVSICVHCGKSTGSELLNSTPPYLKSEKQCIIM
jgi:uncharacterized membrane protein YvbJ